jgi:hypothetical protein
MVFRASKMKIIMMKIPEVKIILMKILVMKIILHWMNSQTGPPILLQRKFQIVLGGVSERKSSGWKLSSVRQKNEFKRNEFNSKGRQVKRDLVAVVVVVVVQEAQQ